MDFTNKPSDFNKPDEDKTLNEIESTPVKGEEKVDVYEPAPVVKRAGDGRGKRILGWTLLTLLVLGLAAAAGWFWWQNEQAQANLRQKSSETASLSAVKNKLINENKQAQTAAVKAPTDQDKIAAASLAYSQVVIPQGAKSTVKVDKVGGGFAAVSSSNGINASKLLLKQAVNKEWVVISNDASNLTQVEISTYMIPTDFQ